MTTTTQARTYGGVHKALIRHRGSAVGRPCAAPGCTSTASGWGLIEHPTTIGAAGGKVLRFSTDLDAYAPTCTRHNSQRDHGGNWTLCPKGHVRAVWGTDSTGTCRGCNREYMREYRRRKTSTPTGADHAHQGTITEQNGGQS